MLCDHDPPADVQAEARSAADVLRREERLEDPRLDLRRDAWPIVGDLDQDADVLPGGADSQVSLAVHRVDGIVDEIGPDLVELAAVRVDTGQAPIVLARHADAGLELV